MFYLYLKEEETGDDLYLHCEKTHILWSLLFNLCGVTKKMKGVMDNNHICRLYKENEESIILIL